MSGYTPTSNTLHWTEVGTYGPHRPIACKTYRNASFLEEDMNWIALHSGKWACDTVIDRGTLGLLCIYNYVPTQD